MATGDSSSSPGHDEWAAQYYHGQRSTAAAAGGGSGGLVFSREHPVTESTVVTTAAATSSATGGGGGDRAQPVSEGRVGKARRRSRASRKAPTTVLNTDTANFRAMVQQFTGAPVPPFHTGYSSAADAGPGGAPAAALGFGLGAGHLYQRPAGAFPFGFAPEHHEQSPVVFTVGGGGAGGAYLRPGSGGMAETAGTDPSIPPAGQTMSRPAASTGGSTTTNRFLL